MLLIPRATEKAYSEQTKQTYIFIVPKNASKQAISKAVSEQFKVTVEDVRTLVRDGKKTRFSRGKHAYPGTTYKQDRKFAYVTLKKGDSIRIFEEEAVEQPVEAKASDKKAAKAAKEKGDK